MNGQMKFASYTGAGVNGTYNVADLGINARIIGVACTSIGAGDTAYFRLHLGTAYFFQMYQKATVLTTRQFWFSANATEDTLAQAGLAANGTEGNWPYAVHPSVGDITSGVVVPLQFTIANVGGTAIVTVFFIDEKPAVGEPI